jgi:hypothetical protein
MIKKTTMTWNEEAITGKFEAQINPGDQVWTFTGVYGGRSISVNKGIFKGVRRTRTKYGYYGDSYRENVEYIVERADGSLTRIQYASNIGASSLTLEQLDGHTV